MKQNKQLLKCEEPPMWILFEEWLDHKFNNQGEKISKVHKLESCNSLPEKQKEKKE